MQTPIKSHPVQQVRGVFFPWQQVSETPNKKRSGIPASLLLETRKITPSPQRPSSPGSVSPLLLSRPFLSKSPQSPSTSLAKRNAFIVIIEIGRQFPKNNAFNINHMKEASLVLGSCISKGESLETDEIYHEYCTQTQLQLYGIENEDKLEQRISDLLPKFVNDIIFNKLNVISENVDYFMVVENGNQLHSQLIHYLFETIICTKEKFKRLKLLTFTNSHCCSLIAGSCRTPANTSNTELDSSSTKSVESSPLPFLQVSFPVRKTFPELVVSGLVIDCGYSECRIVPILYGNVFPLCEETVNLGSKHALDKLKRLLSEYNNPDVFNPAEIANQVNNAHLSSREERIRILNDVKDKEVLLMEEIFTRLCYCCKPNELRDFSDDLNPKSFFNGQHIIVVREQTRREVCQFLFQPICEAIISCLLKLEQDVRGKVMKNILVCGGLAQIVGFKRNLLIQLKSILGSRPNEKQWIRMMGIQNDESISPSYLSWYGASIASSGLHSIASFR